VRLVLFGKADQIMDFQGLAIAQYSASVITLKHLVNLAEDDTQVGFSGAVFEWREGQIKL
jgi:hypothetical protein